MAHPRDGQVPQRPGGPESSTEGRATSFADIARLLEAEPDVAATVEQIVQLARTTIDSDYAGISLVHARRKVETAAATAPVVEEGDALQYQLGEGPCLQAIWSDDVFVVADVASDERWPRWGPRAAELGLCSVLAVRLGSDEETLGALNLYASNCRQFDSEEIAVALVFATHASVALAAARQQEQLRRAVDARHLIGLAQGVLMERFEIDAARAFDVLRRYSQDRNVKLRTIAQEVVDQRSLRPPEG